MEASMSNLRSTTVNETRLGLDAWGRNKSVTDYSLFSGLFTYDVPPKMWKELVWDGVDFVEQATFSKATSVKGELNFTSGVVLDEFTEIRSQEHFRYQANRGHLFSTSLFLDNPTANGIRRWGLILPCNGLFFELVGDGTSYTLNFVLRNHFVETRIDITDSLPKGVDLTKGNLWDIQMQWRGIGEFKLFFNQDPIYTTNGAGSRTELSVENPSLPVGFEVKNTGDEVVIRCGCVDVTSEGGGNIHAKYASFSTGVTKLITATTGTAMLAIRMPYKINYGGDDVCYSRDAVLNQITTFCKDESIISLYVARAVNLSSEGGLKSIAWNSNNGEFVEYSIGGRGSPLDVAYQVDKSNMNLIYSVRQEKDFAARLSNPAFDTSPFIITANMYLVVEIDSDGGSTGGATIEISEQI
jgi:hypothetical protein